MIASLAWTLPAAQAPASREGPPTYRAGQLVVQFKASATPTQRQAVREALGATGIRKLGRTRAESARVAGLTVEQAVARFRDHPQVEFIEPDYLYSTQIEPNDPSYPGLWGLSNTGQTGGLPGADISAPRLWDQIRAAPDVVIAIIDTGVDHRHEDLIDNIYINPGEIADNGIDDDGNGFIDDVHGWDFANSDNDPADDNGHGTHVAGIAGAVGDNGLGVVGVAWDVQLLPLKFLDAEGFGTTSAAVAAIDYALSRGVKIINASWGGNTFSNILRQAVQRAQAEGALFVAAAGNSTPGRNNELFPFYPSSFDLPNIIAVAATDHEDRLAGFSHFGVVSVDLAAPGFDILSTRAGDAYGFLSGTSMATPHVSGALALYKGRFPEIGMAEAKALVLANVDPLASLAGKVLTGGRFNAFRPVADPDDVPPGPIDDLRTLDPNSTRIDLEWTAAGDDGNEGTATRFEVRYAETPIDAGNFDLARPAGEPPLPGPPGTTMRMRVRGLASATTYYFAVRSLDEFGNLSELSNTASGTTLGPPSITVTPTAVAADLYTGQSADREVVIANDGAGEYIYEVIVRHLPGPPDPAPGGIAAGSWFPAAAPGNFEVTDATAANGSRYSLHGFDATSGHFTGVHQDFDPAQPSYAGLYIRSGSVSTADAYFVLRDSQGAEAIFFFASNTGKLFANGDVGGNDIVPYEPHRWYHVEFKNIDFVSRTFDYHVDGVPVQMGIPFRNPFVEHITRVDLYNFHGDSEAWWDEVLISTTEPPAPISAGPATGIVPAGEERTLTVSLNAARLNGGDYRADVLVRGNDPLAPQVTVVAELHVTGAPDIEVLEESVDFGGLFVGASGSTTLRVANRGTDRLEIGSLFVDHPDFGVSGTGFTLDPNQTRDVDLTFSPSQLGPIVGTLTILSNDPDRDRVTVALQGEGELPPVIQVSPSSLEQQLFTGQRMDQTLRIDNAGFSDLEWQIAFVDAFDPILEDVRSQINANFGSITVLIPSSFPFLGGEANFNIPDGGENMYDSGNFLSTNLGSLIAYSNNGIRVDGAFGAGGRYFTRKLPRLFFLAADMTGVSAFAITGNLGADGRGQADGVVLEGSANGVPHLGFVKRVYGTASPSVNHLIVVAKRGGIQQDFSTHTNSDYHVVTGLEGTTRLYYLLYASRDGGYVNDQATRAIFLRFLQSLDFSDASLDVAPVAGSIPAGGSAEATIGFDGRGLTGGVYRTDLSIISNDPLQPLVQVETRLVVIGAPDIATSATDINFENVFVGNSVERTFKVLNEGAETLTVGTLAVDNPTFTAAPATFSIAPGGEQVVTLYFTPQAPGVRTAMVSILSDDPDEPDISVRLSGTGLEPPRMTVVAPDLATEVRSGEVVTRTVIVGNESGSDLLFTTSLLPTPPIAPNSDPGVGSAGEATSSRPSRVEPAAIGPRDPVVTGGDPPVPTEFTFGDDFEDGNLDGWDGGGFGASGGDGGSPQAPADPTTLTSAEVSEPGRPTKFTEPAASRAPRVTAAAAPLFLVSPASGRVAAGRTIDVVVTYDARGLVEGDYATTLAIRGNDPTLSERLLGVSMTVIGEPDLGSSRTALDFGVVHIGLPRMLPFTLTNFGSSPLTIGNIGVDHPSFTVNSTSFGLAPGASRSVNVTFAPEVVGPAAATLTIRSNSPRGDFLIQLSGEGRIPPALTLSADALASQLFTGQEERSALTVTNQGGEDLQYSVAISPIGGSGPPQEILVFRDDIETGPGGWTSEVYAGDDLWHRSPVAAHSPDTSWAAHIEGQGHYGSASAVSTALVSPPIDLRSVQAPVRLWFFERFDTEPIWDQCMVDVSDDGGASWTPLRGAYGAAPSGSTNGWVQEQRTLSNYAGKIVRIRFYFETRDATNNHFPGWFVDDVAVTAAGTPWLALGPATGTLPPGQSRDVEVLMSAAATRPLGVYTAVIEVSSTDPFRRVVEIPASLGVLDPPRIAFPGDTVTLQSSRDYGGAGRTAHAIAIDHPPAGPGQVLLTIAGDFDTASKTATASAEAIVLGRSTETSEPCGSGTTAYPLGGNQLQALAADGVVAFEVRNSPQVTASCPSTVHGVTLTYPAAREALTFGTVPARVPGVLPLTLVNNGGSVLSIGSVSVDHADVSLADVPTTLPPRGSATLTLHWTPTGPGTLQALVSVESNDPFLPRAVLPLDGLAVPSAEASIARDTLQAALPPDSAIVRERSIRLANVGQATLNWTAPSLPFADVLPAAGAVSAGGFVDLVVRFRSAGLPAGDYGAPLLLDTNDPTAPEIEIPLLLHVGEIQPDRFEIDFSPRFATVEGTVEVTLQLPAGLDPADVVPESIALFDALAPLAGQIAFHDLNLDGVLELILQFDLAAFEDQMPRDGDPQAAVPIVGEVRDRIWFRGTAWPRGVFPVDR